MVEIRGKWAFVDVLVSAFMVVFFTMALFDYWPPSPYHLILLAGLVLATTWWLGIGALWLRNTVRSRRRADTDADTSPT